MNFPPSPLPQTRSSDRWKFLRDVIVFQLKLFLDNVRDFALMPVSLVAALIDLVIRGEREGALFYKVLRWGAHSEEVIDVYSAIAHHEKGDFRISRDYTVDGVIARLEGALTREYEKGDGRQYQGRHGSGDRPAPRGNRRRARQDAGRGRPHR